MGSYEPVQKKARSEGNPTNGHGAFQIANGDANIQNGIVSNGSAAVGNPPMANGYLANGNHNLANSYMQNTDPYAVNSTVYAGNSMINNGYTMTGISIIEQPNPTDCNNFAMNGNSMAMAGNTSIAPYSDTGVFATANESMCNGNFTAAVNNVVYNDGEPLIGSTASAMLATTNGYASNAHPSCENYYAPYVDPTTGSYYGQMVDPNVVTWQQQNGWQQPSAFEAVNTYDRNLPPSTAAGYDKLCAKFFSTSGCPSGETCHSTHSQGVNFGVMAVNQNVTAGRPANGVKTSSGAYGQIIQGNADPSFTINAYKTRLCNRFSSLEGCKFGGKCHFAHGESDLRTPYPHLNKQPCGQTEKAMHLTSVSIENGSTLLGHNSVATTIYFGEPVPPGVTAAITIGTISLTKMAINANYAGAVIGKAGANVKQISKETGCKVSIRDHESDPSMKNVEMEGTIEQIERASAMVQQLLQERESAPPRTSFLGSHNFKTKLCENFNAGTCTFADRCHFAHGAHELRAIAR
ncbi:hypothetical protein O6H91_06G043800 [Diphasiastrum complanatum]|uniref:Uncharacterized protein n=1 Tax=Diphasiastrum complanatum TaxID=34168 RepID=A0ACC2DDD9_DIPCM|nr:hypothetical protein O6H91_06G043800 [Diphasiastrum complanatum]